MKNHDPMTNKTKGPIPLPAGDVPTGTRCVSLCIPDSDDAYRLLFGALYELTHWNNWDRDPEHKGTLWAQAWRSALLEGMLRCYQFRVNGGVLQFSNDGGATWSNAPAVNDGTTGNEPQNDEPLLPPRGGSNVPCLAAANATACFVELHREVVEWYNNAAIPIICLGALALILGVFFPVSWAVFGLSLSSVTLAEAFLLHAASLNNAAFTTTIQDELTCIFACNADSYGQWNAAEFAEILVEIDAKSGDMWELIRYYVNDVAGIRGLNNAGTTTSVTSHDCSGCPCAWCYHWNFFSTDGGWTAMVNSGFNPSTIAEYTSGWTCVTSRGVAYPNNYWRQSAIEKAVNAPLTSVKVTFAVDPGDNMEPLDPRIVILDAGTLVQEFDNLPAAGSVTWSGSRSFTTLQVWLEAGFKNNSTVPTSTGTIEDIQLEGPGSNPFGADNCP